jgi:hypothetical protein
MKLLLARHSSLVLYLMGLFLTSCQGLTDIIPPDFEEKLCVIAIITESREQNKIIIEKSFQGEYPSEAKTHLEDISVIVRSESQVVFEYFNPWSENRFDTILLPTGLEFTPNQKYTLLVSEKNTDPVSAECTVPSRPTIPEISIGGMVQTFLPPPQECHNPVNSIVLYVNFESREDLLYYIDFKGYMRYNYRDTLKWLIDYDILESNVPHFKSILFGFTSIGFISCWVDMYFIPGGDSWPSFIDGDIIPENKCTMRIKINLNQRYYDYSKPINVTLNSISKELYDFEKSYSIYREALYDPFSEPVYIKGNITGGYGIFAICTSKQDSLIFPIE